MGHEPHRLPNCPNRKNVLKFRVDGHDPATPHHINEMNLILGWTAITPQPHTVPNNQNNKRWGAGCQPCRLPSPPHISNIIADEMDGHGHPNVDPPPV